MHKQDIVKDRIKNILGIYDNRIYARKCIIKEIDSKTETISMKVLDAFHEYNASDSYFASTTGYGYNDQGRDVIEDIYAELEDMCEQDQPNDF